MDSFAVGAEFTASETVRARCRARWDWFIGSGFGLSIAPPYRGPPASAIMHDSDIIIQGFISVKTGNI